MYNFSRMIDQYSARNHAKIQKLCSPLFNEFKINYFFRQQITARGHINCVGSHVDQMNQYFHREDLIAHNPFLSDPGKLTSGTHFIRDVQLKQFQSYVAEFDAKYSLSGSSFIVIEKDDLGCVEYGFGMPGGIPGIETLIMNETVLIKKFIDYFNGEMKSVLDGMQGNYIDIAAIRGNEFLNPSHLLPQVHLAPKSRKNYVQQVAGIEGLNPLDRLTKREMQCVQLWFGHKTTREIAVTLQLSSRTVEFYLDSIKSKFHCRTKSELMEKVALFKNNWVAKDPESYLSIA